MRISDWSSDVCSSDLGFRTPELSARTAISLSIAAPVDLVGLWHVPILRPCAGEGSAAEPALPDQRISRDLAIRPDPADRHRTGKKIGSASCRERVCQSV